jgi:amphi-Trp domain-containing protein
MVGPELSVRRDEMSSKPDRDVEKDYPIAEFVEKLRRLADALEGGRRFEIQIEGERISVPVRATCNIEHERGDGEEEIEFQIKWSTD